MSLRVNMEMERSTLIIRLEGELDHHTSEMVREKIEKELDKGIVNNLLFNLEELSFMDSSGLGVVLGRYKQIKQLHGEMVVCAISPPIKRLFDMSGLFKIIRLEPTEEYALERLGVA